MCGTQFEHCSVFYTSTPRGQTRFLLQYSITYYTPLYSVQEYYDHEILLSLRNLCI